MKSQRFFFAGRLLAFVVMAWSVAAVPSAAQSDATLPTSQARPSSEEARFSATIAPPATVNTLVNFGGTNGSDPFTENLVQGKDGNIYGTTLYGGTSNNGTVFKVTPSGTLATLHSFAGTDGQNPYAGLVLGVDGNFYGTTYQGGLNGDGTVFKITSAGVLTTLYNFANTDGGFPAGALVQGTDRNFYGTTSYSTPTIYGSVFKITSTGTLTTLHFFTNTDGYDPLAGLVQGSDGKFYGTTATGGISSLGTVFKITPTGTLTSLHSFNNTDGWEPEGQLIQAADGSFYGTTLRGGASGDGEIFKITSAGTLTVLHSFDITDGYEPNDGLVQASDGNFYGTTTGGGSSGGLGTIFEITPTGTLTSLYTFTGITDGSIPFGGLLQHTNGSFYGVTSSGGTGRLGTVFDMGLGLAPFVKLLPGSGKVGSKITILGTNLTGITSVTFNGTAATFTAGTKTYLTATVPTGATTGAVKVVTSGGTLKSNAKFHVTP